MARNDSRINIDAMVIGISNKLRVSSSPDFRNHSIYIVNKKIRKINPDAYMPEIVSIGPFHSQLGSLRVLKEHKFHSVKTFLGIEPPRIRECIALLDTLLENTRKCYAESIKLDNNAFAEMMMLDGFFIIDLFQKYAGERKNDRKQDPLLTNLSSIASLKHDILLLENQLPMNVLVNLLMFSKTETEIVAATATEIVTVPEIVIAPEIVAAAELTMLCLQFFDGLVMPDPYGTPYQNLRGKHLLDLLGQTLHPSSRPSSSSTKPRTWTSVPCVAELARAGVKFQKGDTTDRLLDITFNNGIMKIPSIVIHDLTETMLRNLIAYEQCSHQNHTYMISYAFFMDSLINSEEDVEILCKKDIIKNSLGNNGVVCNLFNTLCNEATLENFYYSNTCQTVNDYYNRRCKRWMASLRRDYFRNPWTILSVVAAVLLLILTILQTSFSIAQLIEQQKSNKIQLSALAPK